MMDRFFKSIFVAVFVCFAVVGQPLLAQARGDHEPLDESGMDGYTESSGTVLSAGTIGFLAVVGGVIAVILLDDDDAHAHAH